MSKELFCMILGAGCASAWWGFGLTRNGGLAMLGVITGFAVIAITVVSTLDTYDKIHKR